MNTFIESPETVPASASISTSGMVPPADTVSAADPAVANTSSPADAGGGISQARREANRRNAQKSTGPRTAAGKAASRMNAKKHGWLARTVVVRGRAGLESGHAFKQLCREHYEHFQPVGPVETMLVDQMVSTAWRLRRARLSEAGEIALSADGEQWRRKNENPFRQLLQPAGHPLLAEEGKAITDTGAGCFMLSDLLAVLRLRVAAGEELTEEMIQEVLLPLNGHAAQYGIGLKRLLTELAAVRKTLEPAVWRARHREAVLEHLDGRIRHLERREQDCRAQEKAQQEARRSAACLPDVEAMNKVLRYETAMQREWYRALNQLHSLREGHQR